MTAESVEGGEAPDIAKTQAISNPEEKQSAWETKWKAVYDSRRAAIKASDKVLVQKALNDKAASAPDAAAFRFWSSMQRSALDKDGNLTEGGGKLLSFVQERLRDKILVDIGAGKEGPFIASQNILGRPSYRDICFNPSECILVDPFAIKGMQRGLEEIEGSKEERKNAEKIELVNADGLSFLSNTPEETANVVAININSSLIDNEDYLLRMAQEVFRAVPEDGIFLTENSQVIEEECKRLFPYYVSIGTGYAFSKSPIPEEIGGKKTGI